MGGKAALKRPPRLNLMHRSSRFCCRFPAVRGQVRSYIPAIADKRSVTRSTPQKTCNMCELIRPLALHVTRHPSVMCICSAGR
ncbi:hypothetical protein E2N91_04740 [Pseudomonas syringae pv. tomato]|nr:hypothetical protein [Pseudomonas syringae pv. tomato]TES60826.1 hypothetical protein E2N91_04740 [Pseudomonas syringae pv. tomato]TES76363.1 hypothetical protein E2N89_18220 [Pseudomonas syringae pv. tomato]